MKPKIDLVTITYDNAGYKVTLERERAGRSYRIASDRARCLGNVLICSGFHISSAWYGPFGITVVYIYE